MIRLLLSLLYADVSVPVTSVSVSGDGVKDGELSLKSGASAQLTATVNPVERDGPEGHVDELGLERRERDGHGRGHGRFEGRHRDDQGHGGRQVGVRPGHGHGRAEAADDGVVQAGVVVEDREGALPGERQVDGLGPADDLCTGTAGTGTRSRTPPAGRCAWRSRMAVPSGTTTSGQGKDYRVQRLGRVRVRGRSATTRPPPSFDESPMTVWYKPDSSWKTAEGQLPGERQVVRRRAADGGLGRAAAGTGTQIPEVTPPGGQVRMAFTHGGSVVGQQWRAGQGLPGERRQCRCVAGGQMSPTSHQTALFGSRNGFSLGPWGNELNCQ